MTKNLRREEKLGRLRSQIATTDSPRQAPDQLVPYARNSRKHEPWQVTQVAESLLEFGFMTPVVVDGKGEVIAGHARVMAALNLGLPEIPVVVRDHLTKAQKRAYVIADNQLALRSSWDMELLTAEVLDLKVEDYPLELLGFERNDLALFLKNGTEGKTDPDAIPELAPARVKAGELWMLGRHRLLCGDSTDGQVVERLIGCEKAALCFTSPPYADQREYGGGKELSTQHLATFIAAAAPAVEMFAVNLGLSRKSGEVNQYWEDYIAAARAVGLKLLSWNVWDRGAPCSIAQQTAMFAIEHEWILVFGDATRELNMTVPNKTAGQVSRSSNRDVDGRIIVRPSFDHDKRVHETYSHRRLGTVLRQDIHRGTSPHPAMFPVALPEAYMEASTGIGDVVYEPFCGSGSTLIACEKTGRRCFGMEIDPHYCDVILARWEAFTGLKAERG